MDNIFAFVADEIEEEERKAELKRERLFLRNRSDVWNLPDRELIKMFRLNKELCQMLIEELTPRIEQGQRNTKISIESRIFMALRFFATGSYQRGVGAQFNISIAQQTVSKYLTEIAHALEQIAPRWVRFPSTREQKANIKAEFMRQFQFPGVVGVIDGTHVAILQPIENDHLYFNRKGYHSKNVQIICDSDLRILSVNANFGGAAHDTFVWRMSAIRRQMEGNYTRGDQRSWLLGDSGYPQEPWLMTPIGNTPEGTPQRAYDDSLTSAKNCIERCIGILKNRFRCLLKERVMRYHPFKAGLFVNACCVLHNMCLTRDVPLLLGDDDDFIPNEVQHEPNRRQLQNNEINI